MKTKKIKPINIVEEDKPPALIKNLEKTGSFLIPNNQLSFYPYFFKTSLTREQQKIYSHNGHLSLVRGLEVKVVCQLDECSCLWRQFSSNKCLFDTWEFRLAFWRGYKYKPYFIVLSHGSDILGLLPLWYEADKGKYFWFGSWWQEENKFLVRDSLFIPLLLAICPSPVVLNAIDSNLPAWLKRVIKFKTDDPKYVLSLSGFNSVEGYLNTLKKKKRYNLRRDKKTIEILQPKIVFDQFRDFSTLVKLSKQRFKQKGEETDWQDKRRIEAFRQVIELGKEKSSYSVRMLTVVIGDKVAAVDLIALYKGCYYPLKCGYDVKRFPGIGNYVNLLEIKDAIGLGMKKMDFLEIGYGWKDKWFEAVPLLSYVRE